MSSISKLMTIVSFVSTLLPAPTAGYWPKRGLAANDDIPIGQFGGTREGAASEVNWQYNWGSTTSQKQSFCEYVPMLWDLGSSATSTWFSHASHWVTDGGSGHLLAFNEPELSGQSNISPSQAAAGFLKYLTPYHGSASLGSPAVSNDGYTWLSEFLGLCTKCKIDFIAVHWYNNYDQFDDLKNWINKICALANGKQVWLTEFEGYGTGDQQSSFLAEAIPWLDGNSCVDRYAYFGVADPDTVFLENGGPYLSPIGVQYTFSAH